MNGPGLKVWLTKSYTNGFFGSEEQLWFGYRVLFSVNIKIDVVLVAFFFSACILGDCVTPNHT